MKSVTAKLMNYRQSPRKVRMVADLIRGKNVFLAKSIVAYANKKAGSPFGVLLDSAIANAKALNIDPNDFIVKEVKVDEGVALRRSIPMSRGRAFPIRKRASHVFLRIGSKNDSVDMTVEETKEVAKSEKAPKVAKKTVKKVAKKAEIKK